MNTTNEIRRLCAEQAVKANKAIVERDPIQIIRVTSRIARILFSLYTVRSAELLPIKRKLESVCDQGAKILAELA